MLYGAAKGTAATIAGMPGDIEQLARQLLLSGAAPDSYTAKNMAAQALLPTSDRVRAMLPSLPGAGPQAQYTENTAASLGQNIVGNLVSPKALPAVAQMAGQGAAATGRFVAPKAGQLAEQYMVNTGGILPLDVYHGSPHTFPPTARNPLGEFDASKIGTGEGNQSFGYGIYTAENPNVGKGYAEQLSAAQGPLGDVAKYWRKNGGESAFRAFAKDAGLAPAEIESTANVIRNTGNLYKVDLPDEKIAQMIDYDKPMAEQRNVIEKMRKALVGSDSPLSRSEQFKINDYLNDSVRMRNLHPQLVVDLNDPRIVERLRQVGIPGVKYFDEGSRGAEAGKQTRNFVVFPGEEKSMTILERNGQPAQMSVADQIDNINEIIKKKRKK